jgi:2-dehydro-3-deoxyphosphogluconate aldolase/(4S)-4-hydroxy-2-oxoglutarate aldolase
VPSKIDVVSALKETGVVVVLRVDGQVDLVPVARALREGGIRLLEITMTMPDALECIRATSMGMRGSDFYIGAGTVLDAQTARAAILAGAEFLVGPGFDQGMVDVCHQYGKAVVAGAMTPTEILGAWKAGVDAVKLFPAKNVGGPDFIKAIKEPLPQVEILPTNGVDFQTAAAYIQAGAIAVGVGRIIVGKELIAARDYAAITENARTMIGIIREARAGKRS